MLVYLFHIMSDMWGDIAYYSYLEKDNEAFQGLNPHKYSMLKLAPQERIYKNFLLELKDIYLKLTKNNSIFAFSSNELLYGGNLTKWIKFVNSLKFCIANRIKHKSLIEATNTIEELKNSNDSILDNLDNAVFKYEENFLDSMKIYQALKTDLSLNNFRIHKNLVDLLKGEKISALQNASPFEGVLDPRLFYYASSKEMNFEEILESKNSNKDFKIENYIGASSKDNILPGKYSNIGYQMLKANANVCLMSAAETYFILAENGDKSAYEKGIRASMGYWNVESTLIEEYLNNPKIKLNL
jgi:hypothetical protein